jgi:hypothetical protein
MTKKAPERVDDRPAQAISDTELEAQEAEALPDREQTSLINANIAAPINLVVAANVLSDGSIAYANAEQTNEITQIS